MENRLLTLLFGATLRLSAFAQGWPADYEGVMLQGFYWDSFSETSWSKLESQASEIAPYFQLVWVPQSGWCATDRQMIPSAQTHLQPMPTCWLCLARPASSIRIGATINMSCSK